MSKETKQLPRKKDGTIDFDALAPQYVANDWAAKAYFDSLSLSPDEKDSAVAAYKLYSKRKRKSRLEAKHRSKALTPQESRPYRPKNRASLPRLDRITSPLDVPYPSAFPEEINGLSETFLPNIDVSPVKGAESWLLWLYDRAGGESMSRGRGAPWSMRLMIGAILHLPISDRDWKWRRLEFTTDEVITWLHPNGWKNRRRDWNNLPAALDVLRNKLSYSYVRGIGSVSLLIPTVIPRNKNENIVEFLVRIPRPAANGARIDWPILCQYGAESALLYRAYLSAIAFMDRSARNGQAITRNIAAPLRTRSGKPRYRDGRIVRDNQKVEPNPAARYVMSLSDADLARLIGLNGDSRVYRQRARETFKRLNEDGVIDLQHEGNTFWLFGPTDPEGND